MRLGYCSCLVGREHDIGRRLLLHHSSAFFCSKYRISGKLGNYASSPSVTLEHVAAEGEPGATDMIQAGPSRSSSSANGRSRTQGALADGCRRSHHLTSAGQVDVQIDYNWQGLDYNIELCCEYQAEETRWLWNAARRTVGAAPLDSACAIMSTTRGVLVVVRGRWPNISSTSTRNGKEAGTGFSGSFIFETLDEHHLWIKEEAVDFVKEKVEQLSGEHLRASRRRAAAAGREECKAAKARKGVGGGADARLKKQRTN